MSRVALIGENSVEYVDKLLDIWNNGDCAVLLDWRIPLRTIYQMMLEAGVQKCYIESRLIENIAIPEYFDISFSQFKLTDRRSCFLHENIRSKYRENTSSDEAVVLYSSGTTGKSKGVILSHYAITTNADAILDYMKLNNNDCLYIVKSLSHSSTLIGELLVSLRSGANVVLAPTVVPPRYVISNIKNFSVTTLCLNPSLLQMFIEELERTKYDLDKLKTIYCSGSIMNEAVYTKTHKVLKKIDVFNVYGLSEAGPRVSAQTRECCKNNSVGKAIKGVEVMIVNDDGIPVNNGERGIIHVNTKSRYSGYISGGEKYHSLYFDWLNTGDIGYIDRNNELHIISRIDDVMIIDSHKVYPCEIEHAILSDNNIIDCCVCLCEYCGVDIICCLYVSDKDCTDEIKHRLRKLLMQHEVPKRYVRVDSIPHNRNGKVDRIEVAKTLMKFLQ